MGDAFRVGGGRGECLARVRYPTTVASCFPGAGFSATGLQFTYTCTANNPKCSYSAQGMGTLEISMLSCNLFAESVPMPVEILASNQGNWPDVPFNSW